MATDGSGRIIDDGIEARTRQVFEKIEAILAEAECTLADVVDAAAGSKTRATSAASMRPMPGALADRFAGRSTTVGQLVLDGKLEVEAIAYKAL